MAPGVVLSSFFSEAFSPLTISELIAIFIHLCYALSLGQAAPAGAGLSAGALRS
jgi:hypothetical protein